MKVYRITHANLRQGSPRGGTYYAGVYTMPDELNTLQLVTLAMVLRKYGIRATKQHPAPFEDGLPMRDDYVCGFSSLEQLHAWFDLEFLYELIIDAGMVVRQFNVPEEAVLFGGHQVMIDDRWMRGEGEIINDML